MVGGEGEIVKEKTKDNIFYSILIIVFVIGSIIIWHPWINQDSVQEAFEKKFESNSIIQNSFEVRLEQWQLDGYIFKVYCKSCQGEVVMGTGFVNLWGDIEEFYWGLD